MVTASENELIKHIKAVEEKGVFAPQVLAEYVNFVTMFDSVDGALQFESDVLWNSHGSLPDVAVRVKELVDNPSDEIWEIDSTRTGEYWSYMASVRESDVMGCQCGSDDRDV